MRNTKSQSGEATLMRNKKSQSGQTTLIRNTKSESGETTLVDIQDGTQNHNHTITTDSTNTLILMHDNLFYTKYQIT